MNENDGSSEDETNSEDVYFGDLQDDFKLFELPQSMISKIENQENYSFYIKGEKNCFLCSENETFHLMKVHCTNSLLLKEDSQIDGKLDCYYELVKKPSGQITLEIFKLVKEYVFDPSYKESENVEEDGDVIFKERKKRKLTMKELSSQICGSEKEILRGLREINALLTMNHDDPQNGFVFLLEEEAEDEVLNLICLLITEKQWDISSVPLEEVLVELDEQFDHIVIESCLKKFSKGKVPVRKNDLSYYNFDWEVIARYQAKKLIQEDDEEHDEDEENEMDLPLFLKRWERIMKEMSNDFFTPNLSMLGGFGYRTLNNKIRWKNGLDLPISLQERLKKLFEMQKRWYPNDLKPYLKYYVTPTMSVDHLVAKNCRTSKGLGSTKFLLPK